MESKQILNIYNTEDCGSEWEYDSGVEKSKRKRKDLFQGEKRKMVKLPSKDEVTSEYVKDEQKRQRLHYLSLDAFSRHKQLVNNYFLFYGGDLSTFKRDTSKDKTDQDVLRENHKFLWDDDEKIQSWEKRFAKKYYDRLFKEYSISDLSRYKENKVALRWRIEKEVKSGKGQFYCGNRKCDTTNDLKSWEVNFAYIEENIKKNALVKLRLCADCSYKLNYHHRKREVKKQSKLEESKNKNSELVNNEEKNECIIESNNKTEPNEDASKVDNDTNIWEGPIKLDEKSKDDEFDEYFEDMFL